MSTQVQYLGFVYIKSEEGKRVPGLSAVRKASKLLQKPKKAHKLHPLFARGFDTLLNMAVSAEGIVVTVPSEDEELIVMNHPMHKVSFVVAVKKTVYVVAKHDLRGKGVMFKCHGFFAKSNGVASMISKDIAAISNNVFKKLRQTRVFVRDRSERSAIHRKNTVRSIANESGDVDTVRMRGKVDADTKALRNLIAQTRISVMEGTAFDAIENISEEQSAQAQLMWDKGDEDDTFLEVVKQLQSGVSAINLSDEDFVSRYVKEDEQPITISEALDGDSTTDDAETVTDDEEEFSLEELQMIDFEDFSDDFARMTLMLHDDGSSSSGQRMPKYAEITLDSDLFNISYI
eukprot:m.4092 g.4092  ORF g.4092 m.4092 type:complete len:346 (-) comp3805_c0_seq1:1499-2536(-)